MRPARLCLACFVARHPAALAAAPARRALLGRCPWWSAAKPTNTPRRIDDLRQQRASACRDTLASAIRTGRSRRGYVAAR